MQNKKKKRKKKNQKMVLWSSLGVLFAFLLGLFDRRQRILQQPFQQGNDH